MIKKSKKRTRKRAVQNDWPPASGREFVRSEEFGHIVVDLTNDLVESYPSKDFSDAVASVFAWFVRKLRANAHFINSRRFPSRHAFKAYVRQALWNAGVKASKIRQKRGELTALPPDRPIQADPELIAASRERLLRALDKLEEPHKSLFEQFFFDEKDLWLIAGALSLTEEEAQQIFEEAVDRLAKHLL